MLYVFIALNYISFYTTKIKFAVKKFVKICWGPVYVSETIRTDQSC